MERERGVVVIPGLDHSLHSDGIWHWTNDWAPTKRPSRRKRKGSEREEELTVNQFKLLGRQ